MCWIGVQAFERSDDVQALIFRNIALVHILPALGKGILTFLVLLGRIKVTKRKRSVLFYAGSYSAPLSSGLKIFLSNILNVYTIFKKLNLFYL